MSKMKPCPCGQTGAVGIQRTTRFYPTCCGRYVDHWDVPAPDAEALMRSRYTAYTLSRGRYIVDTFHPSTRPASAGLEPTAKWVGLEVREHKLIDDTHAEVEFIARYRIRGQGVRLHERSRFVKEDGRWYYVDGDVF